MMEAEDGKPLSTIWRDIFEEDPVQGMRLAISLLPKELTIDQTVTLDATNLTPEDWAFVSEVRKTITDEHLTH